jgi:hypothetical protein
MKNGNVLQLVLVIAGICIAAVAIQYLMAGFANIIYQLAGNGYQPGSLYPTLSFLLVNFLQLVVAGLVVFKSAALANFVYQKANLGGSFKIVCMPVDVLYILLVITGVYFLLKDLPQMFEGIIYLFTNKAVSGKFIVDNIAPRTNWTGIILESLLPAILLIFAKPIAVYFAANVYEEPMQFFDEADSIGETTLKED